MDANTLSLREYSNHRSRVVPAPADEKKHSFKPGESRCSQRLRGYQQAQGQLCASSMRSEQSSSTQLTIASIAVLRVQG